MTGSEKKKQNKPKFFVIFIQKTPTKQELIQLLKYAQYILLFRFDQELGRS